MYNFSYNYNVHCAAKKPSSFDIGTEYLAGDIPLSAAPVDGELTDWLSVIVGVRQACNLSPYLFLLLLEAVLKLALKDLDNGVNVYGTRISNLRFADDIDLIAESPTELQDLTDKVNQSSNRLGLRINKQKTKTMAI